MQSKLIQIIGAEHAHVALFTLIQRIEERESTQTLLMAHKITAPVILLMHVIAGPHTGAMVDSPEVCVDDLSRVYSQMRDNWHGIPCGASVDEAGELLPRWIGGLDIALSLATNPPVAVETDDDA